MSLYYASQSRSTGDGKFRPRPALGTRKVAHSEHRGWTIDFHEHQTGASVKRTLCAATIRDPYGNCVEYLRGYKSASAAGDAARAWIDAMLAKIMPAGGISQPIPAPPQT